MTPDELRARKRELESAINGLLDAFQNETQFEVKRINADIHVMWPVGKDRASFVSATEVEIGLT